MTIKFKIVLYAFFASLLCMQHAHSNLPTTTPTTTDQAAQTRKTQQHKLVNKEVSKTIIIAELQEILCKTNQDLEDRIAECSRNNKPELVRALIIKRQAIVSYLKQLINELKDIDETTVELYLSQISSKKGSNMPWIVSTVLFCIVAIVIIISMYDGQQAAFGWPSFKNLCNNFDAIYTNIKNFFNSNNNAPQPPPAPRSPAKPQQNSSCTTLALPDKITPTIIDLPITPPQPRQTAPASPLRSEPEPEAASTASPISQEYVSTSEVSSSSAPDSHDASAEDPVAEEDGVDQSQQADIQAYQLPQLSEQEINNLYDDDDAPAEESSEASEPQTEAPILRQESQPEPQPAPPVPEQHSEQPPAADDKVEQPILDEQIEAESHVSSSASSTVPAAPKGWWSRARGTISGLFSRNKSNQQVDSTAHEISEQQWDTEDPAIDG